jgi:hypothetical protein
LSGNTHHIWNNEKIGYPPAHRDFSLGYSAVDKVLLSFIFDASATPGAYLDPKGPVLINGRIVPIPDLPQSQLALKRVELNDIDATKFVKIGPAGPKNLIEINYVIPPVSRVKPFLARHVGILTLHFTVVLPTPKTEEKPKEIETKRDSKFCWYCGRSIPTESRACLYCTNRLEVIDDNPKKCRNCSSALPRIAVFCDRCGSRQAEGQP